MQQNLLARKDHFSRTKTLYTQLYNRPMMRNDDKHLKHSLESATFGMHSTTKCDAMWSELLSLTWGNVDFRQRLITVGAAYATNGETRSVPMTAVLTETLKASRINAAPTAAVFCTSAGTPYRDISTAFATAVRRAGMSDFTLHDLRHTFASRLVMAGVDLTTVKELMGHKHITMTLRYAHLAPGHKRSASAVLDRLAGKVPSIFTTVESEVTPPLLQALEK